jgi:hypothetical protein
MGRECRWNKTVHKKFWWDNLQETSHKEDLGLDGRIILKQILERKLEDTNWIHLAQDRD